MVLWNEAAAIYGELRRIAERRLPVAGREWLYLAIRFIAILLPSVSIGLRNYSTRKPVAAMHPIRYLYTGYGVEYIGYRLCMP